MVYEWGQRPFSSRGSDGIGAVQQGNNAMANQTRLCAALLALLMLSACLLTPGKFTSTLDIRKDGSFTFTYAGEVIATDPTPSTDSLGKSSGDAAGYGEDDGGDAVYQKIAAKKPAKPSDSASKDAMTDKDKQTKMKAIADALSKEAGFRSVKYLGGDKIAVDYSISGRLDHSFIFPFNIDAQAVIPFLAVELRKDGKVRVQAPGFANESDKTGGAMGGMGPMGGSNSSAQYLDGSFTLTTDAEIVSQNQEEGATTVPDGKRITWRVTSATRTAPMAVLKLTRP